MAFLDKIGNFAKNVGEKTGDMIEIGKLNAKITTETNNINAVKIKLGDICWNRFQAGDAVGADAEELCGQIKAAQDNIAGLQAEIQKLKEADAAAAAAASPAAEAAPAGTPCPACGTVNAAGVKFCQSCGAKMQADAPAADIVCPSCGQSNAPGTRFCGGCGAKLTD